MIKIIITSYHELIESLVLACNALKKMILLKYYSDPHDKKT